MADYAASSAAQRQRGRAQAPHTELLHGKGQKLGRFRNHCVVMYEAYLFVSGQKPKLIFVPSCNHFLIYCKKGQTFDLFWPFWSFYSYIVLSAFPGLFWLFLFYLFSLIWPYQPFLSFSAFLIFCPFMTFLALSALLAFSAFLNFFALSGLVGHCWLF